MVQMKLKRNFGISKRIQAAFTFGAIVVTFLIALPVHAKNAGSLNFSLDPSERPLVLKYPALPNTLIERIEGKAKPTVAATFSKPEGAIQQNWALSNIGFFDLFRSTPNNNVLQHCSPEVVVAVVDTGIDYTHPDLQSSVWVNPGESGPWEPPPLLAGKTNCRDKSCNGIDDDGNGFIDDVVGWDFVNDVPFPYDTHGHGTHISGIISGNISANSGTSGVCPKVGIMALKYYDSGSAGYNNLSNTVRAIQYAVQNGAQIINYSGGGADPAAPERQAVEEARKKGILFVAAAGNDGHSNDHSPYYPASYATENIIGVASVNRTNQLLPSSNFGRTVSLAAPGLSILSTLPDGRFGTMSGTSQATAFVTGAAALLASQMKADRQAFDFRRVKRWLEDGAKPLSTADGKHPVSHGLLSLPQAVALQQRGTVPGKPIATKEIAARPSGSKR